MEHPTSFSSSSNSQPRSSDDQPQLNSAQAPSSSDTQQLAAPTTSSSSSSSSSSVSTSTTAFNSVPAHQPRPASSSSNEQSDTQHAVSSTSQSESAPATTLWENFMARLRNVVPRSPPDSVHAAQLPVASDTSAPVHTSGISDTSAHSPSPQSHATQNMNAPSAESTHVPAAASHPNAQRPHASDTHPDTDESGLPRPPVFFRLPFNGPDGNPALLAFHPQPLPRRESDPPSHSQPNTQRQSDSQPSSTTSPASPGRHGHGSTSQATTHPTAQPGANPGATSASPHSHSHPEGHIPISPLFVPFGASPLPFSFIYDANTQTAWPIAQVTPGSPPGGPSPDAPNSQQPRLVAGPPFRIILDIHFTAPPEPEQPDPEKAAKYVKQLERADAELRARMARLGMGSIGGFADSSSADDQDALLGCGVCLDNYQAEDRPEWIDGPRSQDEAVVAVPCHGHHTLHAGCLRDWLAKLPPSQWTCPFCRASLDPTTTHRTTHASSPTSSKSAATSSAPVHTTLREDVRARERQRGWRCDAPACLPRYPASSHGDDGHHDLPETSDGVTTDLVKLTPCRHEVHLDCLCTSMRVENDLTCASDLDAIMGGEEDTSSDAFAQNDSQSEDADVEADERTTVGKWVTCPTCRKECWAELPLRKRPQRSAPDTSSRLSGQTASSKGSVKLRSDHETPSTNQSHETAADMKTSHVSDLVDRNQTSSNPASDVADTAADPDEEAAVDAMLVSS